MNLSAILPFILAILQSAASTWKTDKPPAPPPTTIPAGTVPVPDEAIKSLQTFLNAVLALNPPLKVDGWLGPKTDAAIEEGIARLKASGIGI